MSCNIGLQGGDNITPEVLASVDGTSYFWNAKKWSKGALVTGTKNFYAFYPRPYDMYNGHDWEYVRNSVVDIKKLGTDYGWNVYYDFWTQETDANLHLMDLMYSRSESEGIDGRYGNVNKDESSNVQLPFLHAFSLLTINIDKGNYQGDFSVSSIDFSGENVSTSGRLNIMDGTLTPSGSNGIITRTVTDASKSGNAYKFSMIVPPTSGDVTMTCKVDGAEYKCTLPDIDLKSGCKYNVDLSMRACGDIYLQVWDGAMASINGQSISGTQYLMTEQDRAAGEFKVVAMPGYKVVRILKNGSTQMATSTDASGTITCSFDSNPKEKTNYTIVTEPEDWYAASEYIRVQYDGLRNNPYIGTQDRNTMTWTDLSGHGYDGALENFVLPTAWDEKGLTFNGTTSIVTFPGTINSTEYTMEFYIFMEETQHTGGTPRLNAEGTDYPAYYFRKNNNSTTGSWHAGLYGHGNGNVNDKGPTMYFGQYIMQLDFVYSHTTSGRKLLGYLTYWKDGKKYQDVCDMTDAKIIDDAKSIPKASLGRRISDFTRALTGTYYSYILYDKALSAEQVNANFDLNYKRYGAVK